MAGVFERVQNFISEDLSWFYILAVAAFFAPLALIAVSRFGSIRLGPDHSRPSFRLPVWFAMLFSTGMGIGIMFFGIAEPVMHFLAPPAGDPKTIGLLHARRLRRLFSTGAFMPGRFMHRWA